MDDKWAAQRDEGGDVVVEGTIELFPGRNFRVEGGMVKQIERQIGLYNKMIPQVSGESGGNTSEDGDEVALKFLDGSLHSIVRVDVRRDKLELDFQILYHDMLNLAMTSLSRICR